MFKKWDIVWNFTILDIIIEKPNAKYKVICNDCWIILDKFYNRLNWCRYCKPRNRILIDCWEYIKLELTWWEFTKINKEDYEKIKDYCWYNSKRKSVESRIDNKLIKLHRLITWINNSLIVDHINWDTLDNRRCNLRICNHSENSMNKKHSKNSKTWIKWVWQSKWKYNVQITKNWKKFRWWAFISLNEAIIAVNNLTTKLHWEYAKIQEISRT